jgi:hypothetical protein
MQLAISCPDDSQSILKLSSLSFTRKRDTICLELTAESGQFLEYEGVTALKSGSMSPHSRPSICLFLEAKRLEALIDS